MKLTFSFHKWVTPLHAEELTEVETAQVRIAGSRWWSMVGDYDVQAVLRNLDEGADYGSISLWRVESDEGDLQLDVPMALNDTASVFIGGTAKLTGISMIQGSFDPTEELQGLDPQYDWPTLLQEAWREVVFTEEERVTKSGHAAVVEFTNALRRKTVESAPVSKQVLGELLDHLREREWTPETETEFGGLREYCSGKGAPEQLLLQWFEHYAVRSDSGIRSFINDSLRLDEM